ncbi:MAG: dihydroneopterin aldolase [Flavobacteriaceae bacterium]
MDKIEISDIRLFACHGCLKEESIIGSDYSVDLSVWGDLGKAADSDNLVDTIDYVHLHNIVKEEMEIPSKLLEHVSSRIIARTFKEIITVEEVCISVAKINPPIGGDVASVKVVLCKKRN